MAYTTIDDPSAYFQIALYTGNGTADTAITNDGNSDLQPDWIWFKERSATDNHLTSDSSRGVDEQLYPNLTNVADTDTNKLESFNSDGFTLNDGGDVNENTRTYVAWQWKANGGSRTTNTESGNNPAGGYQANTTAGFSIVDWTGTGGAGGLMAHGLGAVPHVIITKTRSHANAWAVYHHKNTAAPETDYLKLDSTAATADNVNRWNDTVPTSTNLVLGDVGGVNSNDQTQIAYVFTSIQGYSKFGSYEGNGNADGPFAYTGFKPRFVIIKEVDAVEEWFLLDTKRDIFNPVETTLYASGDYAESGGAQYMDFLSNGIKIKNNHTGTNTSGNTYVYMAWAEHPFVSSEGVPTTAR